MSALNNDIALFARVVDSLLRPLTQLKAAIVRAHLARQSRAVTQQLLTHDDRLLSDIGVSRSDVEQALSTGWDQDPARILADIRRRRMQADRQGHVKHRSQ